MDKVVSIDKIYDTLDRVSLEGPQNFAAYEERECPFLWTWPKLEPILKKGGLQSLLETELLKSNFVGAFSPSFRRERKIETIGHAMEIGERLGITLRQPTV